MNAMTREQMIAHLVLCGWEPMQDMRGYGCIRHQGHRCVINLGTSNQKVVHYEEHGFRPAVGVGTWDNISMHNLRGLYAQVLAYRSPTWRLHF